MAIVGGGLGHFHLVEKIGEGGMGVVYRARDERLGREVAIKVLPVAFTADSERLARFEREARVLASLSHPNVAGIHEVGHQDGTHFLVMELARGETLADRIARGPIPLSESLSIALQIAEALEAAHERGIVHRDLKPANVMVDEEGRVKLLDFGLARALEEEPGAAAGVSLSHSPTMTRRATLAGFLLGTAAYMSPEQARGVAVDKRADIWAFGVVLFEMLAGRSLFAADTVSDTLAAVLRQEVELATLPAETPDEVRRLVGRCLERDPKRRLRDVGEARIALSEVGSEPPAVRASPRPRESGRRSRLAAAATLSLAVGVAAALGAWVWPHLHSSPPRPATRLSIVLPPGQNLVGLGGPAVTRDGRMVAYTAADETGIARLYLRPLDSYETTVVPESEGASIPFFSPDASRIGFFARGKLMTAAVQGGPPTAIADASATSLGASWGDDDTIVYSPSLSAGLLRVASTGGTPEQLTTPDEGAAGYAHSRPQFLPGGQSLLFTVWGAAGAQRRMSAVLSLEDRTWKPVAYGYWIARYAPSGHLLFAGPRGVRAAIFDLHDPRPVTAQAYVVDDVFSTMAWADSWFAVSDSGTLVYVPGEALLGNPAWVDREGRATLLWSEPMALSDLCLSPDGTRIAMQDRDDSLWTLDLRRGTRIRLTSDAEAVSAYPVWSPDGARILFASNRSGDWEIYSVPSTGGRTERVLDREGNQFPASIAPDGTVLFNERSHGRIGADLMALALDGTVTPFLDAQPASKVGGQFSPDGSLVVFLSDESGRDEIYVKPFGRSGEAVQISTAGGNAPRWSADGREVVFRHGDAFMAASVGAASGRVEVGDPRLLFEARAAIGRSTFQPGYSVGADGRLLVHLLDPKAIPTRIDVVLDWFDELRAKVPAR